ncbi:MAG: hypothetical protein HOV94_06945 [Saccharothrix sp.]|nr:hypothetical protein [Saccharothrix sp.]
MRFRLLVPLVLLVDELWGDRPPANIVQARVFRPRKASGDQRGAFGRGVAVAALPGPGGGRGRP